MVRSGILFIGPALVGCASAFAPTKIGNARADATALSMAKALIVQNKGGGHGELGFQLAKKLSESGKIDSITILQDKACNLESEPFKSYASDIPDVDVIFADLGDESLGDAAAMQDLLGDSKFEYIYDNYSKGPEGSSKALCDIAKGWDCVKLYTYISSAGMYQPTDTTEFPMAESTTPIKESAGQAKMDNYIAEECKLPLVSFRPQYIYGEKSNKHDYIDWFFDRLAGGLPLLIPSPGTQKVSLTNSQDVASLLVAPLEDETAAVEQRYFNCGTDKLVTYDEVAFLCAEAAGIDKDDVKIQHYSGDEFGKVKFPFRLTDFYVAPDMAKEKLGYSGAANELKDDITWYYENYKSRDRTSVDLSKDEEVLAAL